MNSEWLETQFRLNPRKTRAELARQLDLDPPAISKILAGKRQIKAQEYIRMREFFDLPEERAPSNSAANDGYVLQPFAQGGMADQSGDNSADSWVMPASLLKQKTQTAPENIRIFSVQESAMAPDFLKGEQVLVDLSDTRPSPPGVFVVSDGMSHMIRSCEYVPHSDPPKMKLNANSQKFSYVMEIDKAAIIGRVIAKLQWL